MTDWEPGQDIELHDDVESFVRAVHGGPSDEALKTWGIYRTAVARHYQTEPSRGARHGTVPTIHSRDLAGLADAQGSADHRRGRSDRGDRARRGPVGAADRYPAPQRRPKRIWRELWAWRKGVLVFLLFAGILLISGVR